MFILSHNRKNYNVYTSFKLFVYISLCFSSIIRKMNLIIAMTDRKIHQAHPGSPCLKYNFTHILKFYKSFKKKRWCQTHVFFYFRAIFNLFVYLALIFLSGFMSVILQNNILPFPSLWDTKVTFSNFILWTVAIRKEWKKLQYFEWEFFFQYQSFHITFCADFMWQRKMSFTWRIQWIAEEY